ncbi:winged helix-turn-helix transcriptional regulator [Ralstonia pseudosolanacearum]|uniref:winged helix-turn-helix transcriptional regulator n=1 Tax=Ralstonia pseudosolanacearum TaxID=1310165 RepID=UPI0009C0D17C|nr:helix-turn-helix domain-containing protein [Ralstonia pseudosolanacearum]MDC6292772.1 helix-turn-helix domain-containing protein [Ralstonia pseudosolanacearum]MDD7787926.1 helix-turn-helix domain-containing protein [Ralstonia pseudosolanacearum]MDN3369846.1 helix-turn-helix domain-containing protein [Ralstonia pseudosolanacearum]QOK86307.1 helix-turn-helix transcriptional regulator [Ralstonia pseudosolanacearum]
MGLPLRKDRAAPPPACQVTEALGFLRGARALNVVWQLRDQARRFGELRHDLPRISARVLSLRLHAIESRRRVVRHALDSSPPSA